MKELKTIQELKRFLWIFKDIKKIARQISNLDIKSCNVGLTDKQEKRTEKLLRKANELLKEFDLKAYHQSDPRGLSLYLLDLRSNLDYTEGIPVY